MPKNGHFSFSPLKAEQKEMVHLWLKQDYIKEWIHGTGLQNTLKGIEKFLQNATDTIYWIGYDYDKERVPFAFLITSPEGEAAITLDMFICDKAYLGKGFAVPLIHEFILKEFPQVKKVLIDPEATNTRAIHVYKKAGFKITGEFIASWHPVPHFQMELYTKDLPREKYEDSDA